MVNNTRKTLFYLTANTGNAVFVIQLFARSLICVCVVLQLTGYKACGHLPNQRNNGILIQTQIHGVAGNRADDAASKQNAALRVYAFGNMQ